MDARTVLAFLAVLVAIVTTESAGKGEPESADLDESSLDKRPSLFRYGRGGTHGLFRYGKRGGIFRYGKRGGIFRYGRGSIFRYGKRSDDYNQQEDEGFDSTKRLFRWGKRSDDEGDFKRLFRWGKRSGEEPEVEDVESWEDDKRRLPMRYGKRSGEDQEDIDEKRIFRYGKRDMDALEEIKRRLMRYGRDTRAPQKTPHVPFRFGEREEE